MDRKGSLAGIRSLSLIGVLALFGSGDGLARPGPHPHGMGEPPSGQPQAMMPMPVRENRLQWISERDENTPRRPPKMTPEERRELRRQIHDAGREIYPRRRQ